MERVNKKLVALLIPLMLVPLAGFAYATWSDEITKTWRITAGTLDVGVVDVYVKGVVYDGTQYEDSWDVNCDGEPDLRIYWEYCTDEIRIECDKVFPCWWVEIEITVENKGNLPVHWRKEVLVGSVLTNPVVIITEHESIDKEKLHPGEFLIWREYVHFDGQEYYEEVAGETFTWTILLWFYQAIGG